MDNYLDLYKQMTPNSIKLSYRGVVNYELVDSVLNIVSEKLEVIEENINIRKRVYSIVMETLQNLCNHIEPQGENLSYDAKSIILAVENETSEYKICTGNFIPNDKVPQLKEWLDMINSASKDELKQLYNTILTNNNYSDKGGGGLGFIDIARKSNNKLEYKFHSIDEKNSFFSLNICIRRN